MLDRVDRIQMAVAEAAPVARLFQDILGAEVVPDPRAAKRGDSLYMCYAETDDVGAIMRRLGRHHARFTPRGGDPLTERDGLWIHPSALSGLLLGISGATVGRAGPSSSRTDGTTTEAPS